MAGSMGATEPQGKKDSHGKIKNYICSQKTQFSKHHTCESTIYSRMKGLPPWEIALTNVYTLLLLKKKLNNIQKIERAQDNATRGFMESIQMHWGLKESIISLIR